MITVPRIRDMCISCNELFDSKQLLDNGTVIAETNPLRIL